MAISVEGIHLAKRKVFNYLSSSTRGNPFVHEQMRAVFSYLAQHGVNPDLQFVPYADLSADTVIADAACKIYAIFGKKRNTATDAFFKGNDSATVTSGTDDDINLSFLIANQVQVWIDPAGWAMANGFTIASDTAANGTTSTTAGDGPDGFVLLGNP
jgi:hypothetical protein